MRHILRVGLCAVTLLWAMSAQASDLHHDDFQSGEAGAKAGTAIYNSTIGKDNPLQTAPTWEEQARQKARDMGREHGERLIKPKSSEESRPDSSTKQSETWPRSDNPRRP